MKAAPLLLIPLALLPQSAVAEDLLLKNARIYTVSGALISRGDILIRSGKIVQIGTVNNPSDARVIDLNGKTVMPGIVDANARYGARDNEQSSEVTPRVSALHLLDSGSPAAKRALMSGVTTACITPGSSNVIGGVCAAIRISSPAGAESVLRNSVAVRAALGSDVFSNNGGFRGSGGEGLASIYNRRPNSRMAAVWELRKALFEAQRHPALVAVLEGRIPLRVHARTENDIRALFTIMDEFKLKRAILDDAVEAYKVADQLAARKIPVVLGPLVDPQTSAPEGADALLNTAGLLAEKGVKVALGSNGGAAERLREWAALAARHGMPPALALRAITLTAAEIVGISSRVGSIEAGKDADLIVLSGDPLQLTSRVEMVISRGQVVHDDK